MEFSVPDYCDHGEIMSVVPLSGPAYYALRIFLMETGQEKIDIQQHIHTYFPQVDVQEIWPANLLLYKILHLARVERILLNMPSTTILRTLSIC